MNDLITKNDYKPKSFWERPEGTTGMLTIAGLGLLGFFGFNKIAPFILNTLDMAISMVGKAIALTGLGALLFVILYVLFNPTFQTACSAIFKNAMRKLTGVIVEIDPIGIMKNYIDSLKKKKAAMDANVNQLRQQISVMEEKIKKNNKTYSDAMKTANAAKNSNNALMFSKAARSAGRMEQSTLTYQGVLDKMTVLYRALQKYQAAVEVTIDDLTEEVAVKEDQRKSILSASNAMRGAMAILMGGGADRELFDQAMEFTVRDYGMRIGEIDDFMDTTKGILAGIDLQNDVFDADAMDKLAAWEAKADSIVLGDTKRLMLEENNVNTLNWGSTPSKVSVPVGDDLNKFFK